ncbi:cell envelope biogenesis protein OmpA [Flavobacterium sp. GSP27]|uniref:Cell envelope biogenesis protein OmpA n=1 Tax=Flavobacterium bomense TaxID=2497483 RepID=A0A3S0PK51_9FLAO|nr:MULTISPECIES: OmpA family protein [Flavobacterium]RTY76445.1 cell envelope biogenesis protein OmpA [Flavobacterium sp. LS1R10]RTY81968.1 cell envelope biogenesis protein OmpA [Flavobacterium sp. ZB4P23]RTY85338.1 cell envelope biogenesis protein OmpA [Flavobacterium sp. LS1P28]RTZ07919.1 cell envelope biogenesis protein OmpA [Flavobacterium bomense]RTZ09056.1 cell envelope biogenesis protein OmpA [Flavobacterium sp. GSP6]
MIKKFSLGLLVLALSTSCVSKKIYNDLESKYADSKKENRSLTDENEDLLKTKNQLDLDRTALTSDLSASKAALDKLKADYAAAQNKLEVLQDSYAALEKNSGEALQSNMKKNRDLLGQLDEKAKALAVEQERLSKSAQRLQELEDLIAAKEANMKKLKETLSNALNSFEGKGLTVEQKNGKVYVSMENKLLFNSGSWSVGSEGKKAVVELGKVLGDNPEISVLIEGHTDDDAFSASGPIADNWDLSTKRATAIVAILSENSKINKQSLTAAGRGEFSPLASNATADGKAKNRRIEIILTPRLDEIAEMLNEIN